MKRRQQPPTIESIIGSRNGDENDVIPSFHKNNHRRRNEFDELRITVLAHVQQRPSKEQGKRHHVAPSNAVKRVTHKERSQPQVGTHLGILKRKGLPGGVRTFHQRRSNHCDETKGRPKS
jgi:hypothetical protein